ncbi:MAG: PAS domain-containing protein, partial [Clostridium sp.]|nr:PAS domain-containing protein [Clostridium sp.]
MEREELFNLLDFKNILKHTTDMIQVINGHGDFLYVNESWKIALGYQEDTISTLNLDDILISRSKEDGLLLNKIKNGTTIKNVNLILKSSSGDDVPVQGSILGISNEKNQSIKAICILNDRSEIRNKNIIEDKLMKIIHTDNDFRSVNLEGIDYQGISNLMLYLSDAQHVTFNLYDQFTGELQTMASAGNSDLLKSVEKILGFGIVGKKWEKNQEKKHLFQDKAIYVIKDLLEITKDILEETVTKTMQKELGIGEVILVNIIKEGVSLGDFTLVMNENKEFYAHEIIELFATQIGLVIAKHDAEKKLIKNKEKFIHTIEATGAATWEWDLTNNKVTYSSKWAEMLGYSPEELQGTPMQWEELWHPDDKEMIKNNVQEYLSGKKENYEIIHRLRTKSNEYKWIKARGSVLKDVEKNSLYFIGIHIDVTHIHNEETQRINENKKLNNILDATNVGIWEWNILTDEMVYNERWAEILGYTLEEISPITRETFKEYTYPGELEKSEAEVKEIFEKKKEYYSVECKMKHKNGQPVWVLDSGKVISWTPEGKPAVMFGAHIDITESKNLEM